MKLVRIVIGLKGQPIDAKRIVGQMLEVEPGNLFIIDTYTTLPEDGDLLVVSCRGLG